MQVADMTCCIARPQIRGPLFNSCLRPGAWLSVPISSCPPFLHPSHSHATQCPPSNQRVPLHRFHPHPHPHPHQPDTHQWVFLHVSSGGLLALASLLCVSGNRDLADLPYSPSHLQLPSVCRVHATLPHAYTTFRPRYLPDSVIIEKSLLPLISYSSQPGCNLHTCPAARLGPRPTCACVQGFLLRLPVENIARLDAALDESRTLTKTEIPLGVVGVSAVDLPGLASVSPCNFPTTVPTTVPATVPTTVPTTLPKSFPYSPSTFPPNLGDTPGPVSADGMTTAVSLVAQVYIWNGNSVVGDYETLQF